MEWWGCINYQEALARMTKAHAERIETIQRNAPPESAAILPAQAPAITSGLQTGEATPGADSFFYLEHPPVITYGRATPTDDLLKTHHSIPTLAVPRGGLATYHAPGQLIGYIVMDLSRRAGGAKPDIHAYLRALEVGLIAFLKDEFNLDAGLREGFTGVWTTPKADERGPGRKLASIGVSARKWVTSHGFALNIHPDMTGFQAIVPCGITDAEMTSVMQELENSGQGFNLKAIEDWAGAAHKHLVAALQDHGWLT